MKTRKRTSQDATKEVTDFVLLYISMWMVQVVAGILGSFEVQNGVGNIQIDSRLLSLRRSRSQSGRNVAGRALVIRDSMKDIFACGVIEVVRKGDVEWHGQNVIGKCSRMMFLFVSSDH